MNQESNKCSFCKEIKPVLRQYLHPKNKIENKNESVIIYYCNDCDLLEYNLLNEEIKNGDFITVKPRITH